MNNTEKKVLEELSKSLSDVREFAFTIKHLADNLVDVGAKADNVQEILKDNNIDRILQWLSDGLGEVKMLMRILK